MGRNSNSHPAASFLRVTLPAGKAAWGNANIPLPIAKLRGKDGKATFYTTDTETGETWRDAVLPWSEFRDLDGIPFDLAATPSVNLQICRPHGTLPQALVIDIETVDSFRK